QPRRAVARARGARHPLPPLQPGPGDPRGVVQPAAAEPELSAGRVAAVRIAGMGSPGAGEMELEDFRQRWSALHGGVPPTGLVGEWLRLVWRGPRAPPAGPPPGPAPGRAGARGVAGGAPAP